MPLLVRDWPRAILHVDGDSFFASCEIALNPTLKGQPVVTGQERGIASSMSAEAKQLGVTRGMPIAKIRQRYPQVVVVASNYENYGLFSQRIHAILRRFLPVVEPYSIDEYFADLTGMRAPLHKSYGEIGELIKKTLEDELGLSFSLGVAPTKVLAKLATNWKKPSGVTVIPGRNIHTFLAEIWIEQVWGIGSNTAALLKKYGINTALDFVRTNESWIEAHVTKPFHDIWHELRGSMRYPVTDANTERPKSISRVRTFSTPRQELPFLLAQLSKNIEHVCAKLRTHQLWATRCYFFLKTQQFQFKGYELKLNSPTHSPAELMNVIEPYVKKMWQVRTRYRATGFIVSHLTADPPRQLDLFQNWSRVEAVERVYQSVDALVAKYGSSVVFLGSSLDQPRTSQLDSSMPFPFLGEVA